jgi:hypothetical protein
MRTLIAALVAISLVVPTAKPASAAICGGLCTIPGLILLGKWLLGKVTVSVMVITPAKATILGAQKIQIAATLPLKMTAAGGLSLAAVTALPDEAWSATLDAFGLVENPVPRYGAQARAQVSAAISSGLDEWYQKVCPDASGAWFPVPIESVSCLDGSEPRVLDTPFDLAAHR